MRWAEDLVRRTDDWVFAPADARRLAALRIGLCGVLALRLASTDYGAVARQPALFRPLHYMHVFNRMPSPGVAHGVQICGIIAASTAATGLALRVTLPLTLACSLVLDGMLNSAGRVIVSDAVLTLCLIVILASKSAAGDAWSIRPSLRRALRNVTRTPAGPVAPVPAPSGALYGWPVRTAMITVALAYFFAGFQKWRYSGLPWVTSDNLRWILYASSDSRAHPDGLALFIADRPWLAHLLAAGSLLLESSFPLVLFLPRLRWLLIAGVGTMHLGIRLAIGLDYSAQWLTTLVVFVNWPAAVAWLRETTTRIRAPHQAHG